MKLDIVLKSLIEKERDELSRLMRDLNVAHDFEHDIESLVDFYDVVLMQNTAEFKTFLNRSYLFQSDKYGNLHIYNNLISYFKLTGQDLIVDKKNLYALEKIIVGIKLAELLIARYD